MIENDGLDLAAIDILAPRDNHVLQPVKDVEVSVGVPVADISSAKESVSKSGRRILQVFPVSAHYACSARHEVTMLTGLHLLAGFVRDSHLYTGTRSST